MIYELDKEMINFLCKKKISFNQFAICLLVYRKDTVSIIKIEEEFGKIGDCLIPLGNEKYISEIDDLIKRDFLEHDKHNKSLQYAIDNLVVTEKFLRDFIDPKQDLAQEFWDIYPKNLMINGMAVPATACDYDEFAVKYLKAIKSSPRLHREIIAKLKNVLESNPYAQMNILNFVGSRHWEQLDEQPAKTKARTH